MAELRVMHVLPRWHHGGPAQSILVEAEHARAGGTGLQHSALVLEKGGSIALVRDAVRCGLRLHVAPPVEEEALLLGRAELVVLHFWNTPSVRRFIDRRRGTRLRWMLYCAVNGLWQPQRLPIELAEHACHVILTSPHLRTAIHNERISVVPAPARMQGPTPGGMEIATGSILHAGTLNVFKLEPRFIRLHSGVARAEKPVVVAGSGGNEDDFRREAETLGIADGFHWVGFRHDLPALFANAKLLSHPSSRFTYASSDRVLQESQLFGVPVLVQKDSPLAHLVQDGVTGILANDTRDFQLKLGAIGTGDIELPGRKTVLEAAREQHDPSRRVAMLEVIYRDVRERDSKVIEDGFADLRSWLAYEIGDFEEVIAARRPTLAALGADAGLLYAHQRWACEGGLAQYINNFPRASLGLDDTMWEKVGELPN